MTSGRSRLPSAAVGHAAVAAAETSSFTPQSLRIWTARLRSAPCPSAGAGDSIRPRATTGETGAAGADGRAARAGGEAGTNALVGADSLAEAAPPHALQYAAAPTPARSTRPATPAARAVRRRWATLTRVRPRPRRRRVSPSRFLM